MEPCLLLVRQLGWSRIAVIWDINSVTQEMMNLFLAKVEKEHVSGVYNWTACAASIRVREGYARDCAQAPAV